MTDIDDNTRTIEQIWRSFGNGLGSGAGALVALISLIAEAPLMTACGRGAATLLVVKLATSLGAVALSRTTASPKATPKAKQEQRTAA